MMTLNPEQEAVVLHQGGPLRVGAVAGAGKTTAIVERVSHLVEKKGVPAERILLISFSKIARDEMAKRLVKRMPAQKSSLDQCVRTFHSIGLAVYREEIGNSSIDTTGLLWTRSCHEALRRLAIDVDAKHALTKFASRVKCAMIPLDDAFSLLGGDDGGLRRLANKCASEANLSPDDLIDSFRIAEKIRTEEGVLFQDSLRRFVTFDDMLYETALLLRSNRDVRERWQSRWSHVLQDEAQDENEAQAFIAEALAEKHRNYVIVGDPAQSIYGFRGSNPKHILRFHKTWPDCKTILMHRNYRSALEIVRVANEVIGHMPAPTVLVDDDDAPMEMTCERKVHGIVRAHHFDTASEEADAIAETVRARYDSNTAQFRDQAVLVRMNYMTCAIELAFARAAIPYRLVSGSSFFDANESKQITAMCRVAMGRASDKEAMGSLSSFRLSKAVGMRLFGSPEERGEVGHVEWAEQHLGELPDWQGRALGEWLSLMKRTRERSHRGDVSKIVSDLADSSGLTKKKSDGEDSSSSRTIEQYASMSTSFSSMAELLDMIDRIEKQQRSRKVNAVTISTIHKAKGAEWSIVYLPQLAHGCFPSWRADWVEERRVFYVAATRARDELWMSHHLVSDNKDSGALVASPFVKESGVEIADYEEPKPVDKTPIGQQIGLKL
jgi:DNA helicase-2/ATP-dependent DNA helicase PcrA